MPTIDASSVDRFAAFRHSAFKKYWGAHFLSAFAVQIVSVSVGWQIYDLTRDAFNLGMVGLVQFLPALLLVLVTGAAADRFGRRLIVGLSLILEGIVTAALLAFTLAGLFEPLTVFAALLIFGVARAFLGPSSASLVVNLVPTEDFANAVSWNSSAWQVATIVGPVAGGLLYGISPVAAYSIATLFLIAGSLLIFSIPKPRQHTLIEERSISTILAGFRYIYIYGKKRSFWAPSHLIFSPSCSAARWRSCPSMRATFSTSDRGGLDCCAQHPALEPSSPPSGWPATRSAIMRAAPCSSLWACSASSTLFSVFQP